MAAHASALAEANRTSAGSQCLTTIQDDRAAQPLDCARPVADRPVP
jgi:hypothetical protein